MSLPFLKKAPGKRPNKYPFLKPTKAFGLPKTPFNPLYGWYENLLGEPNFGILQLLTVVDTDYGEDFLQAISVVQGSGGYHTIIKPYLLQRSVFDGKTVNGISYVYSDNNTRVATKGDVSETQRITPDYIENEQLFAISADGENWYDLNTAGRCWAVGTEAE